jgi:hypothetical protein
MGAVRGPFPIPRSRRGLLVAGATLVIVLGGAACGGGKPKHHGPKLSTASFPGFQLSFRYPATWHRKDWCWVSTSVSPVTLLTTSVPADCSQGNVFGFQTPLPPPQRIGPNGVAAWWAVTGRRSSGATNTRIAGKPVRITATSEPTRRTVHSYVNCTKAGATQRLLTAVIEGPSSAVRTVTVGAVICGPHFAAGEAAVRAMLASLTFTP